MLRKRSKGVANKSQHMLGKAMDFYIPGVPLKKLRETGLKMQMGGVGYYPRSGSPFVHLDVGSVRHWPRMSRKELVAVFPNGKTLHVPCDGKPLPGFETGAAPPTSRARRSGTTALALAASPSEIGQVGRAARGALRRRRRGRGQWRGRRCAKPSWPRAPAAEAPKPSARSRVVPPELASPAAASGSTPWDDGAGRRDAGNHHRSTSGARYPAAGLRAAPPGRCRPRGPGPSTWPPPTPKSIRSARPPRSCWKTAATRSAKRPTPRSAAHLASRRAEYGDADASLLALAPPESDGDPVVPGSQPRRLEQLRVPRTRSRPRSRRTTSVSPCCPAARRHRRCSRLAFREDKPPRSPYPAA